MTMTSPLTPVLDRGRAAMDGFSKLLTEIAGIDAATADRVTGLYLRHKLATIDYGIGRMTVKHGALLDRETILRAAKSVQPPARPRRTGERS
jgi:hypothetical protein